MSYRVLKEFTTPRHRHRVGSVIEEGDIDGRMTAERLLQIGVLQEISRRPMVPKMAQDAAPEEPVEEHEDVAPPPPKDKDKK